MRSRSDIRRSARAILLVVAAAFAASCDSPGRLQAPPADLAARIESIEKAPSGLTLRLTEGQASAPAPERARTPEARRLSDEETTGLLARLPAATAAEPAPAGAPVLKPGPPPPSAAPAREQIPPPREPSPPAPRTVAVPTPLRVVEWSPEGNTGDTKYVKVVFSQPMATTWAEAAPAGSPVKITPAAEGSWRWKDSRTLQFEATDRLAGATPYEVEIPAGMRSSAGGVLAEAKRFSFTTGGPNVVGSYPPGYERGSLETPIVLQFDQRIVPADVLPLVRVSAAKNAAAVRLASDAEVAAAQEADPRLKKFLESAGENARTDRLLILKSDAPWPRNAHIAIEILAGVPSAEGPNPSRSARSVSFYTLPPLSITDATCERTACDPGDSFEAGFSTELDPASCTSSFVEVSPSIEDMSVSCSGTTLRVRGEVQPLATYEVKFSGKITDTRGQQLGRDEKRAWRVAEADPSLRAPWGMTVLEPGAKPAVPVELQGYDRLALKIWRVEPKDHEAWSSWGAGYGDKDYSKAPGTKVFDDTIVVTGTRGAKRVLDIDLGAAVGPEGFGHAIVAIGPDKVEKADDDDFYRSGESTAWIQLTHLGLDAFADRESVTVYVSELASGAPASGVDVSLEPGGISGRTGRDGLVTLAMPDGTRRNDIVLVARRGADSAFVEGSYWYWSDWSGATDRKLVWHVDDDRGTYRPGEEVAIKGWIRTVDFRKRGDVGMPSWLEGVQFRVRDARQNTVAEGKSNVSAAGGFDARFKLSPEANLGEATIELWLTNAAALGLAGSGEHTIDIREFRRPEFEVKASSPGGPALVGGGADMRVDASYFAGGPLAGAPVRWTVSSSQTRFVPPGHSEYDFGAIPSWGYGEYDGGEYDYYSYSRGPAATSSGTTGQDGSHTLHLDLVSANPAVPMKVTAETEVIDVNRQAWNRKSSLIVHPADLYVGLRMDKSYVDPGTDVTVSVIGVDRDGRIAAGAPIDVTASRAEWGYRDGTYGKRTTDVQRCFVTSGREPVTCRFHAAKGGSYDILASIADPQGRVSQTVSSFYASGWYRDESTGVREEKIELSSIRRQYAGGETARVTIGAPFYPAEATVTIRRSGIVDTKRLRLERTMSIDVPITDSLAPSFQVQVDAVGQAPRTQPDGGAPLPPRPAYASGAIQFRVTPKSRILDVSVAPDRASVTPASEAGFAISVRDAKGAPVAGAEVAVFVVDEAILALSNHSLGDPIKTFHPDRGPGASDWHSREHLLLRGEVPAGEALGGAYGEPEEAPGGFGDAPPPLFLRKDMSPLAAFFPALVTDAEGRASASFKLPDSVTRYRIMAIAAADAARFGKAEASITAELPLVVRPSAPRFLNFGDVFDLPVVVQNRTDREASVKVALRASNLSLTQGAGREVTIPANDRVELRFPAAAGVPGQASFDVVAASSEAGDAASVTLPVSTPAAMQSASVYGVVDEGAVHHPLALPDGVWPGVGGLDVTTSSTNLQSLTDAILYLVKYPYECAEQMSSRILAVVAMEDVLSSFRASGLPSPEAIRSSVEAHLKELVKRQGANGGFGLWSASEASSPFVTAHATHALLRAKERGYEVPPEAIEKGLGYLRTVEGSVPDFYTSWMRAVPSSYALYVRALSGDVDVARVREVIARAGGTDKVPAEACGWMLGAIAATKTPEKKALTDCVLGRVRETSGTASFPADYEDRARLLFYSTTRSDGVVLEALIRARPDLAVIPKLTAGLLAQRKSGQWSNTQDNAFALLALNTYFRTFEKEEPDFLAKVWLGDGFAGEHAFRGRSTESAAFKVSTPDILARSKGPLAIAKDGPGRLYYRAALRYAPKALDLVPAERGFVVDRRYEGADDPRDVVQQGDGSWKIRLGARVKVRVGMRNNERRYQVALVDPLPAGLEPIAPVSGTGATPSYYDFYEDDMYFGWWNRTWQIHQNLRDDRAEAFASLLWPGSHDYEYTARATTPGTFVVPPARAEEMYSPDVYGHSASTRVVIE